MTDKRKRFCEEYVIDCDATKAAIRSGYSPKAADSQGCKLIADAECIKYIRHLQKEIADRNEVTADMVVQELKAIGFYNVQDLVDTSDNLLKIKKLTRHQAKPIVGIENSVTYSGTGKKRRKITTTKIKLADKVNALMLLGKHTGVFEKDNKQKGITIKVNKKW